VLDKRWRLRELQKGVSLLEMILVLAILSAVAVAALRFFAQRQYQMNETKILANVNQLFQATSHFYYANCRRALDTNGNIQSEGRLDPTVTDSSGIATTLAINIQNDLLTPGYILTGDWHPANPLVDNSADNKGYYVQFNRVTEGGNDPTTGISVCSAYDLTPSCHSTSGAPLDPTQSPPNPTVRSHAVTWVIQVAVKLSSTLTEAQWTQIKNDLDAQCISSLTSNTVAPCSAGPDKKGYLVWQRTISYLRANTSSDYWVSMPYVKQFQDQYTNDPMGGYVGVTNETLNSTSGKSWYNAQNYLCGG
jgi:prepilin-type N-terminal cleavage/methylation domain-containing protein